MSRMSEKPESLAFALCRQVVEDCRTHDIVLISPTVLHLAFEYPSVANLAVFALWTNAHGAYLPEVQLRDLAGAVIWRQTYSPPMEVTDPLDIRVLTIPSCRLAFPNPGKYEVVLMANGDDVVRTTFLAKVQQPRR